MITGKRRDAVTACRVRGAGSNRVIPGLGAALVTLAFMVQAHDARAIEIREPLAVVELFTSQGCSSCPSADSVLREFNARDEILGLALHVDYWDRLGWKDTFASAENTKRQWRYANALGERQVYTPQAIVNGRAHFVGSRKADIQAAADRFDHEGKGLFVPINLSESDGILSVSVPQMDQAGEATLYAVYYNQSAEVAIAAGENAGRTLAYSNIVGKMETIGMLAGRGIEVDLSIEDLRQKGYSGCALVLQEKGGDGLPGPIIGATVIGDL